MRKNSLTTAIIAGVAGVAGLAGVANAVILNPDGIGQVLLYPYYTVNGDNTTLISVVNTSDNVKAVKVRFLESMNSKEVLDFNLYLSPYDVWTAAVVDSPSGLPRLVTEDTSCTVPAIPAAGQPFSDSMLAYWNADRMGGTNGVDSPDNIPRMRQGHIEMIEMGDLIGVHAASATHVNGVPRDCDFLVEEWELGGTWMTESGGNYNDIGKGLTNVCAPGSLAAGATACGEAGGTGGIFGGGLIVNGAAGLAYSYNADAINGFYRLDDNLHYQPGTVYPRLSEAETIPGFAVARVFTADGTPVDAAFPTTWDSANAVTAVLQARYIANEYYVDGSFAQSDWVVTFPTKEVHTYRSPAGVVPYGANGTSPFTRAQGYADSTMTPIYGTNTFASNTSLCEPIQFAYWDREERTPRGGSIGFSPPRPGEPGLSLCLEANVIGMGQTIAAGGATSVLKTPEAVGGRGISHIADQGFKNGWARIGFTQFQESVADAGYTAVRLGGLPVIGFWAAHYVNENVADGVLANYNQVHRHRVSREIGAAATPAP